MGNALESQMRPTRLQIANRTLAAQDDQIARDQAHHARNIAWLTGQAPVWGDGEPMSQHDVLNLLRINRECLALTNIGMSTGGSGKHEPEPSPVI